MATETDAIVRKVTIRLVPFLCLLYFISYLDRVNIGFAALTMNDDLKLSGAAYGLGASMFFVGYFCSRYRATCYWTKSAFGAGYHAL